MLESHFEPDILAEKALRRIRVRIFDALLPTTGLGSLTAGVSD
jgi:hypothetical protein